VRLEGKVAIVTGAGSGMGEATAMLFAREGAKVIVAGRNTSGSGEKTAGTIKKAGGEAIFIKTDVSRAEDVQRLVKAAVGAYGRLDVLYNNAAVQGDVFLTPEVTEEVYDKYMDVNLKGVWLGMKYAIPEMLKTGAGSITNVASISALVGQRGLSHYAASKGGIISLTRVTAMEYAANNIRVNCVCPGLVRTPIWDKMEKASPGALQKFVDGVPMRRYGKPEEIAQLALFLASDESSFITGSVIVIDGGATASASTHPI
jgi:NAD(P)-dependent dehydrogenase (short-subunit alcohol dehydrogenase family)